MNISILFPPAADFTQPYLSLPYLAASLRAHGHHVSQRDINIEAYDALLTKERLQRSYEILSKENLSSMHQEKYGTMVRVLIEAPYIIEHVHQAKEILRSHRDFYDFTKYSWSIKVLRAALRLLSAECYPSELTLRNYKMRYPISTDGVMQAIRDAQENIFLLFFHDKVVPSILKEAPNLIGISIIFCHQTIPALTLADLLKKANKDIHICIGGSVVPYMLNGLRESSKLFSVVDSLVSGRGEHALLELAATLENGGDLERVPNLTWRSQKRIKTTKQIFVGDINDLLCPDFDGLPLGLYLSPELTIPLMITRGCYWGRCAFCTDITDNSYQERKIDKIVSDIHILGQKHHTKYFTFWDSCISPNRLVSLSSSLLSEGLSIKWQCLARPEEGFTREVCQLLADAGCRRLSFGIESASQRILDLMEKGTDVKSYLDIIRNCYDSGITCDLLSFIGFPTETEEEARETLEFIRQQEDVVGSFFTLGTFMLEEGSKVQKKPWHYGVTEIFEQTKSDLFCGNTYDYDVERGMTQSEAEKTWKIFQIEERNRGTLLSPAVLFLRAHLLLYLCEKDAGSLKHLELEQDKTIFL